MAVDERTDTIYVVSAEAGTVSVIDGATCNARRIADSARPPALVPPLAACRWAWPSMSVRTRIYVGNLNDSVSVIDGVTCNRLDTSGCGLAPAVISGRPGARGSPDR